MNSSWRHLVILLGAAAFVTACAGGSPIDVNESGSNPTPPPGGGGGGVSFSNEVLPAFSASCTTGCHAADGTGGGLTLAGDAALVHGELSAGGLSGQPAVNTANPAQSPVLNKPDAGNPAVHSGGKPWSTSNADYQTVLTWIQEGAQNN